MDPLVHTKDQGTSERVDFTYKEGEDCPTAGKVMGIIFCDPQRFDENLTKKVGESQGQVY